MPHSSIYFPTEYSKEDVEDFMDKLAKVAKKLGYITHGGPKAGRGNIRSMMQGIVSGELIVLTRDEFNELDHGKRKKRK